jgi:hypothetical protein
LNKIYLLILLTSLTTTYNKGQDVINFRVGYLPNYNYTVTLKQNSENNVKYIASDDILQKLENNGIENPTIKKDTVLLKSVSKTGELKENEFLIDIEYLESNNTFLSSGTKFFGKSVDGKTKIDSIYSLTMTEEEKRTFLPTMETMMNQIKYPNRKIRVGESFSLTNTISMPIADVTIQMEINSIYTLKKIENGVGYFDLDQTFILKSATKNYEIVLDGRGKGQIDYDMQNQFITKYYLEMEMNLKAGLEAFSIEVNTKNVTDQKTEIEKVKR